MDETSALPTSATFRDPLVLPPIEELAASHNFTMSTLLPPVLPYDFVTNADQSNLLQGAYDFVGLSSMGTEQVFQEETYLHPISLLTDYGFLNSGQIPTCAASVAECSIQEAQPNKPEVPVAYKTCPRKSNSSFCSGDDQSTFTDDLSPVVYQDEFDIDSDDLLKLDDDAIFNNSGYQDVEMSVGQFNEQHYTGDVYTSYASDVTNSAYDIITPGVPRFKQRRAANKRERRRMQIINDAFEKLRRHLPSVPYEKKLSKVETLRSAIDHISFMARLLETNGNAEIQSETPPEHKVVVYCQDATSKCSELIKVNTDADAAKKEIFGHSLSWSWEDASSEDNKNAVHSKAKEHNSIHGLKKRKKTIRAPIWQPRFPADKNKNPEHNQNSTSGNCYCSDAMLSLPPVASLIAQPTPCPDVYFNTSIEHKHLESKCSYELTNNEILFSEWIQGLPTQTHKLDNLQSKSAVCAL